MILLLVVEHFLGKYLHLYLNIEFYTCITSVHILQTPKSRNVNIIYECAKSVSGKFLSGGIRNCCNCPHLTLLNLHKPEVLHERQRLLEQRTHQTTNMKMYICHNYEQLKPICRDESIMMLHCSTRGEGWFVWNIYRGFKKVQHLSNIKFAKVTFKYLCIYIQYSLSRLGLGSFTGSHIKSFFFFVKDRQTSSSVFSSNTHQITGDKSERHLGVWQILTCYKMKNVENTCVQVFNRNALSIKE